MNKEKKEQIILIVLIPVFLLGILYFRSQKSPQEQAQGFVEEADMSVKAGNEAMPETIPGSPYFVAGEDPFINLLQIDIYRSALKKTEPVVDSQSPLPDFVIQGIVWNTEMPQAILNGQVIRIGDTIEGVKVLQIEKEGITILYRGEKLLIKR
jgi:hypothetical protein